MAGTKRWDLTCDIYGNYIKEFKEGGYITYRDHKQIVNELQSRIDYLEEEKERILDKYT